MTDLIRHRGPDGEGQLVDGAFAIGHRRLSIIDPSQQNGQPMVSDNDRYVLSYNGELYNFREIRRELQGKGYVFRTEGDTEVVLNALIEWREGAFIKFNGMFALALWDRKERSLLIARDRFGVKPLYFARIGATQFAFASEIKAFAALPAFKFEISTPGLHQYLSFQNFFNQDTLFRNVWLLPAATWRRIEADNTETSAEYWDYSFSEPAAAKSDEYMLEQLDSLFKQAVNRQLVSDVELGAYLSGGMDSGSITAIAAQQLPYIKTFTCGFDLSSASGLELSFDERAAAERMSYRFHTEHYEMVLKSGDMERVMPRLVWHMEEPRVGQCYPNFYAAKLAGKFVKVVLSGAGGDELFGGYPWRYYRAVSATSFTHYVDRYYDFWQRLVPDSMKPSIMAPVWNEVKHISTRDIFESVFTHHARQLTEPEDYLNHSLYLEAKTFLHGLLVVEDKVSMAHSLESRVPFLDNDLVAFAMALPASHRLGNLAQMARINENEFASKRAQYFRKFNDGKLLLRRMMTRHIPEEVANREKQGFSAPDASWFKGESIDYVRRLLCTKSAKIYDYLDRKTVEEQINQHLEGRENKRLLIWSLIYLETLLDVFVSGARPN